MPSVQVPVVADVAAAVVVTPVALALVVAALDGAAPAVALVPAGEDASALAEVAPVDVPVEAELPRVSWAQEPSRAHATTVAATRRMFTNPSSRTPRPTVPQRHDPAPDQRRSRTTVSSRTARSPFGPVASRERISAISVVQPSRPSEATSSEGLTNSW